MLRLRAYSQTSDAGTRGGTHFWETCAVAPPQLLGLYYCLHHYVCYLPLVQQGRRQWHQEAASCCHLTLTDRKWFEGRLAEAWVSSQRGREGHKPCATDNVLYVHGHLPATCDCDGRDTHDNDHEFDTAMGVIWAYCVVMLVAMRVAVLVVAGVVMVLIVVVVVVDAE